MTFDSLDHEQSKYPFIYIVHSPKYYANKNLRRYQLTSLDRLGLIEYKGSDDNFVLPKKIPRLKYFNNEITLSCDINDRINTGNVRLTSEGAALYQLTEKKELKGYLNVCMKVWDEAGIQYVVTKNDS